MFWIFTFPQHFEDKTLRQYTLEFHLALPVILIQDSWTTLATTETCKETCFLLQLSMFLFSPVWSRWAKLPYPGAPPAGHQPESLGRSPPRQHAGTTHGFESWKSKSACLQWSLSPVSTLEVRTNILSFFIAPVPQGSRRQRFWWGSVSRRRWWSSGGLLCRLWWWS